MSEDRCPTCGYTAEDCRRHMDHHLCPGPGPQPYDPTTQPYDEPFRHVDRVASVLETVDNQVTERETGCLSMADERLLAEAYRIVVRGGAEHKSGNQKLSHCGYCKSWHSKPCGEGCFWQPSLLGPSFERIEELKADQRKLDAVVHALGIEDSEDDPAEVISAAAAEYEALQAKCAGLMLEIERLSGVSLAARDFAYHIGAAMYSGDVEGAVAALRASPGRTVQLWLALHEALQS